MDALLLDSVCKSFGEVRAVDGLSLRVPSGSICGFLGPNGAGKTTTIRMIMNILRPDTGRIVVLGESSVGPAKDRIGYMPEERGLYRKMRVGKMLAYFGGIKGLPSHEVARQVPWWLDRMGLSDWADRKVEDLSKGMQQKLQFAVTCVRDPDLLILDEPFSGLDPVNVDMLKEIVLQMRAEGKTILFSTHVMYEAERLCDSILLINKGRAVVDGTMDEIRSRWPSHAVSAELQGETGFIEGLPMVAATRSEGRRLEITLTEDGDPQELLRTLVERVRVSAFEVKVPSLHEIFVRLVGPSDG